MDKNITIMELRYELEETKHLLADALEAEEHLRRELNEARDEYTRLERDGLAALADLRALIKDRGTEVYTPRHGWVGVHLSEHERLGGIA